MNTFIGIGRLTRDPELKFLPNGGQAVCKFSLALDKNLSREKKEEARAKGNPTADFPNIVVWGKQAESCANYLAKGRLVAVQGRLQTGSYDKPDGTKVYTTDIVAERVEFLEWGDKTEQSNGGSSANFEAEESSDIPF